MKPSKPSQWKFTALSYTIISFIALVFLLLSYGVLSKNETAASSMSISVWTVIYIPAIAIWLISLFGSLRLKQYAHTIKDSPDGSGLNTIANALLLLVLHGVLLTVTGISIWFFAESFNYRIVTVIGNYLPIIVVLASAVFLFIGSRKLKGAIPIKLWNRKKLRVLVAGYIAFAGISITGFYLASPDTITIANGVQRFALPIHALLLTYLLPYLAACFLASLACINLAHYSRKSPGIIYRNLFKNLYKGIVMVFICTFLAQLVIVSGITITGSVMGLMAIYAIIVLAAYGFLLIYSGASNLHKIENSVL